MMLYVAVCSECKANFVGGTVQTKGHKDASLFRLSQSFMNVLHKCTKENLEET